MKKSVGYVILALGFFILALGVKPVNEFFIKSIPFLEGVDGIALMVLGAIILVIGVFTIRGKKFSRKQLPEVPIFHGKEVVGYRRV